MTKVTVDMSQYPSFLDHMARDIDISPQKYRDAVHRYQRVGNWLQDGDYPGCPGELAIYPQGSFRLGIVVRPIRRGIAADYDIDLVCELPTVKSLATPQEIKQMVGERLRQHDT